MTSTAKSVAKVIAFVGAYVFVWIVYVVLGSFILAWSDTVELIYKKKTKADNRSWWSVRDQAPSPPPTFITEHRRHRRRGHRGGKRHRNNHR